MDALLGEQTRPHDDLDIVVQQEDVPTLRRLLDNHGYQDVERDDTSPWNFVLGDAEGRLIDIHAIVLDDSGNGLYGPIEKGVMYPAGSLKGEGMINGQPVRCIAADYQVQFHNSGYLPRGKDFQDVSALCQKFTIPVPDAYRKRPG